MRKYATVILGAFALLVTAFAGYVYVINLPLPQTEYDVAILERAIELLADEDDWSKQDDRTCGPNKEGLSLYCALRRASVEVAGEFEHRAAALQEVRYEIERQNPTTEYAHRLMDYNNDESTRFEDMHTMLRNALDELKSKSQQIE